ncbi:MAG: excinuclease ABC subunit A [Spirochaetes bacterium GWF1_51_8]|nr:MAG: excinuclease ABC subunit A [Spirochaetes bacterium GWF1_51_8]
MIDKIIIKGAKEHNLKNIDLEIPRDKLVVITGVSGSGKSSIAFDTVYAEGERRYLESLSAYARQFLGKMKKPDVEYIEGLSPSISIQQQSVHANPRSIVATVTEIYDYLRLLWGRIGIPHCPECGRELVSATVDEMIDTILDMPKETRFMILAPKAKGKKGTHQDLFKEIAAEGFARVRVDGEMYELESAPELNKNQKHDIDIVVDRLKLEEGQRARLADSVEAALHYGDGVIVVLNADTQEEKLFSEKYYCPEHNFGIDEVEPRMFSFNSPYGACPRCGGLGEILEFDENLIVQWDKSIHENAIMTNPASQNIWMAYLRALAKKHKFSLDTPMGELPRKIQEIILYGEEDSIKLEYQSERIAITSDTKYEGVIPNLKRRYFETQSEGMREWFEGFMTSTPCPVCNGDRLRKESLGVTVGGKNIIEVTKMSIPDAYAFFDEMKKSLSDNDAQVAKQVLKEIDKRIKFIIDVGLDYINLFRKVSTLSGGEFQRIRLATQIGSGLMGVLYVLDEPTIGLHARDTDRLINTLEKLRDTGNTVLVVEHDEEMISRADWVIDIGPGAGIYGGELICAGTTDIIKKCERSLTGLYLSGKRYVEVPKTRREGSGHRIEVFGASEHNLKEIDIAFPLGKLISVTGVSGSGKSTLVNDILYKAVFRKLNRSGGEPGVHKEIKGLQHIDKVIDIDQSPIGRTPRSNPVTYTGVFTLIRDLFTNLPEAKARGYKAGRFSFNVKGGRCEACEGEGYIQVEMHFLPDVFLTCDVCGGKRYNKETLQVKYKGKSIADVLDMPVDEAVGFFDKIPSLARKLLVLQEVGLGYLSLGQPATTLSGGEAQRVKLAKELSKVGTGRTLYILDEPTVGLHFDDTKKLVDVLQRLVGNGNTVAVIEHNMDVIKVSDWLIDLGPEGGDKGGTVMYEGTPEGILECAKSYTGQYLKKYLRDMGLKM